MALIKSTLSEQIYQILRNDILTLKISPGEKLTLKNLQEQFDVSSTPIREALTRLSQDGLVDYYSNIGVNVVSLSEHDLKELYQFMGDLDKLAILYTANHPDYDQICQELGEVISVTSKMEEGRYSIPLWIENSDRFHLIFYQYCNNQRLTTAAEKLRSQLTIFSNIYETQWETQKKINQMHVEIYNAYIAGDFAKAGELMKQHLNESYKYALTAFHAMEQN